LIKRQDFVDVLLLSFIRYFLFINKWKAGICKVSILKVYDDKTGIKILADDLCDFDVNIAC